MTNCFSYSILAVCWLQGSLATARGSRSLQDYDPPPDWYGDQYADGQEDVRSVTVMFRTR